jgi:hypothetical protein
LKELSPLPQEKITRRDRGRLVVGAVSQFAKPGELVSKVLY